MALPASSRKNRIEPQYLTGPITHGKNAILSDTIDMPFDARGIYLGVAGDVKLITPAGSILLLKNLVAGVIHPIETRRVFNSGTTATNIVLLW